MKTLERLSEELVIEVGKLHALLLRCQDHLEEGDVGDALFEEINRALGRFGEYAVSK